MVAKTARKPQHGGKRKGSGRPNVCKDGVTVAVYLPQSIVDWLDSQGDNRSEVLRNLLADLLKASAA